MERAIQHMNEDHADALVDIARHFGGGPFASTNAHLQAMTRSDMTIAFTVSPNANEADREVVVPFTPPLANDSELRPRLVQMAKDASVSRVPRWEPPAPGISIALVALLVMLGIVTHVERGMYATWPRPAPAILNTAYRGVELLCQTVEKGRLLFYFAVALHLLEGMWAAYATVRLMNKDGRGWGRVVKWTLATTLFGFPSAALLSGELAKRELLLGVGKLL
jgi:Protein of unknown function (DUF2470)/Domain of unknown function (DUF4499)